MTLHYLGNTCNICVSYRNTFECNLNLTQIQIKCNILNFADNQIIKHSVNIIISITLTLSKQNNKHSLSLFHTNSSSLS